MIPHWAFWLGGLALAAVAIAHWLLVQRMFAVSGRFTALVDRLRLGPEPEPNMTEAEMIAAMREATRDAFGEEASTEPVELPPGPLLRAPPTLFAHTAFLVSLIAGGALSALLSGALRLDFSLRSEVFPRIFGDSPWITGAVLLFGGILVGFGTRMAGGCTSGHGLCGVSRFQSGSLLSTAAFFGMGVALSLLLARLV